MLNIICNKGSKQVFLLVSLSTETNIYCKFILSIEKLIYVHNLYFYRAVLHFEKCVFPYKNFNWLAVKVYSTQTLHRMGDVPVAVL